MVEHKYKQTHTYILFFKMETQKTSSEMNNEVGDGGGTQTIQASNSTKPTTAGDLNKMRQGLASGVTGDMPPISDNTSLPNQDGGLSGVQNGGTRA